MDEPDVHLHPDLQSRFVKFICELIDENDHFQIIIATHSTAILGAFSEMPIVNIAFMKVEDTDILFQRISQYHKNILPVFGAHPLSEIFNNRPIFLVEGEDDVRIWQQSIRTSIGRIRLYPVSTDTIDELNSYELEVQRILTAVYDNATAYSLRDRDESLEDFENLEKVIRFRLSCRNAESLILTNEVLAILGTTWETMKQRIRDWIDDPNNIEHEDYETIVAFRNGGFQRKSFNLKDIRNILIYFSRSRKPWEIAVGQAIGNLTWTYQTNFTEDGSLNNFLGEKLVRHVIPEQNVI